MVMYGVFVKNIVPSMDETPKHLVICIFCCRTSHCDQLRIGAGIAACCCWVEAFRSRPMRCLCVWSFWCKPVNKLKYALINLLTGWLEWFSKITISSGWDAAEFEADFHLRNFWFRVLRVVVVALGTLLGEPVAVMWAIADVAAGLRSSLRSCIAASCSFPCWDDPVDRFKMC